MVWQIVTKSQLPLGKRRLDMGCHGQDVSELQSLLSQSGFYFGPADGFYGILTEEAVGLLQKTLGLRVDGVVGRQTLHSLENLAHKTGRIIYSAKEGENLTTLSQKFDVRPAAWHSISGQGNPRRRIYSGMKLLLHEKVFFRWDSRSNPIDAPVTGSIHLIGQLEADGSMTLLPNPPGTSGDYSLLSATPEVWESIMATPKIWPRLSQSIRETKLSKVGLDLSHAPWQTIPRWQSFVKIIAKGLRTHELTSLVIPLIPAEQKLPHSLLWATLPILSKWTHLLLLEPLLNSETPQSYFKSVLGMRNTLRRIFRNHWATKTLWVASTDGWDWNESQNSVQKVSYKEARLIRAMNSRKVVYDPKTHYTRVNYIRRGESHSLVYRDEEGWADFLQYLIRYNLMGVVIREFSHLGSAGTELIMGSFAVLPEHKLTRAFSSH